MIAPHERKVRIAVGRGLERALPDPFCQAVIDRRILPAFRSGHYDQGVEAGVQAIVARLTR